MDLYYRENSSAGSVTLGKLSSDIVGKLNQSKPVSLTAGMVTSVGYNDDYPSDHTIFERTDRNASHQWEEMAPVSVGRYASDGLVTLNNKIYFVGGYANSPVKNFERYDPSTNQWETLPDLQVAREGLASAELNGKIYAIGGVGRDSVEIFDPVTNQWSYGISLPKEIHRACAISINGRILLSGGNSGSTKLTDVYEFDPIRNTWESRAPLIQARAGHKMVAFNNRVWVLGDSKYTESYDLLTNSWRAEPALNILRSWPVAWTDGGSIFVGGGILHPGIPLKF